MGVHGLWKLIESSGKPIPLEALENRVLAVDVSIWLYQLVKGFQEAGGGQAVANAYLLGLFHRICKLLFYRIKPIFVFDGGVPVLKRRTIADRQSNRTKANRLGEKLRQTLLENLAKQEALGQVLGESVAIPKIFQPKQDTLFQLPPLPVVEDTFRAEDGSSSGSEMEEESPKYRYKDIHSIDIQSEEFLSLPADIRHDILTELKETRKQNSWGRLHLIPKESNEFSDYQMRRLLKRRQVQEGIERAEGEMGVRGFTLKDLKTILTEQGVQLAQRIAADNSTRLLYSGNIKNAQDPSSDAPPIKKSKLSSSNLKTETTLSIFDEEDENIIFEEEEPSFISSSESDIQEEEEDLKQEDILKLIKLQNEQNFKSETAENSLNSVPSGSFVETSEKVQLTTATVKVLDDEEEAVGKESVAKNSGKLEHGKVPRSSDSCQRSFSETLLSSSSSSLVLPKESVRNLSLDKEAKNTQLIKNEKTLPENIKNQNSIDKPQKLINNKNKFSKDSKYSDNDQKLDSESQFHQDNDGRKQKLLNIFSDSPENITQVSDTNFIEITKNKANISDILRNNEGSDNDSSKTIKNVNHLSEFLTSQISNDKKVIKNEEEVSEMSNNSEDISPKSIKNITDSSMKRLEILKELHKVKEELLSPVKAPVLPSNLSFRKLNIEKLQNQSSVLGNVRDNSEPSEKRIAECSSSDNNNLSSVSDVITEKIASSDESDDDFVEVVVQTTNIYNDEPIIPSVCVSKPKTPSVPSVEIVLNTEETLEDDLFADIFAKPPGQELETTIKLIEPLKVEIHKKMGNSTTNNDFSEQVTKEKSGDLSKLVLENVISKGNSVLNEVIQPEKSMNTVESVVNKDFQSEKSTIESSSVVKDIFLTEKSYGQSVNNQDFQTDKSRTDGHSVGNKDFQTEKSMTDGHSVGNKDFQPEKSVTVGDFEVIEEVRNPSPVPQLSVEEIMKMKRNLEKESSSLIVEASREDRIASTITDQIRLDAQELLELFGIPYITAPMEAEAQCAYLDLTGQTQGTITDDSDVWLFGGRNVYKNFFDQKKFVLQFKAPDIKRVLHLERDEMIMVALLTGSDYTLGLTGVGAVTALEVVAHYPRSSGEGEGASPYQRMKSFAEDLLGKRISGSLAKKLKKATISDGFPSLEVINAYLHPEVDESTEKFTWSKPNLKELRRYALDKFGWDKARTDKLLEPILENMNKTQSQGTLHNFFEWKFDVTAAARSKRIENAINLLKDPALASTSSELAAGENLLQKPGPSRAKKIVPFVPSEPEIPVKSKTPAQISRERAAKQFKELKKQGKIGPKSKKIENAINLLKDPALASTSTELAAGENLLEKPGPSRAEKIVPFVPSEPEIPVKSKTPAQISRERVAKKFEELKKQGKIGPKSKKK